MRLATFEDAVGVRFGVVDGDSIADVAALDASLPRDLAVCCAGGLPMLQAIGKALTEAPRLPLSSLKLLAPLPRPARNIFCVGKNYREHAKEFHDSGFDASSKDAIPDLPIIFTKAPSSVIADKAAIPAHLDATGSVDYEGELAVVIGKGGRGIGRVDAASHIFGYTIVNDVTSRTLQHAHKQWFLGKSIDGFCPMGPWIVTADEIGDVSTLRLETRVNGELRQNSPLSDLIFDIPTLIETISARITLESGDVIATGTPAGVGIGFNPPKFLRAGDVVSITVDRIGTLSNSVA